jgi:hypothetical protein
MRLDSAGNLGLGVTPSAWASTGMQVGSYAALTTNTTLGSAELTSNAYRSSGSTWNYINSNYASRYRQYDSAHAWFTAPSGTAGNAITFTQAMTLDASGRLLIGTTTNSNGEPLQIDANGVGSTLYTALFRNTSTSTSVYNAVRFLQGASGSAVGYIGTGGSAVANTAFANNFVVGTQSSSALVFNTNDTERARIDSSGNLLVGTTDLNGTSGIGVKIYNPGYTDTGVSIVAAASANTSTAYRLYSTGAAAYRFYVGYGGTVYATSTSISAISDRTLKENICDLETGLTEVMALRPRRFDWKNGDAQKVAGFIAQEVEEVLPELVTDYIYNKDEEGNDIIKKSLKMGDILPTLVKAIQEQQAIIETLTARITALEQA